MRTALIVEGTRSIRSMVSFILATRGYRAIEATDRATAMKALRENPDIGIVIIGLSARSPYGVALMRDIRSLADRTRTPILLLVRDSMLDRQREWKEAGATCWITKPFTPEKLMEMVEMVFF